MTLLEWINQYKVYVAPSNINGVGLFAIDDIKKGDIVYTYLNNNKSVLVSINELLNNGVSINKINVLKRLFAGSETSIQLKTKGIDFVSLMNHNADSNMEWSKKGNLSIYRAKKDIKANEEVTLDFLDNNYHKKLNFKPNE